MIERGYGSMDIESAVKFPTEDENWVVKVLIGGIISLIPIVDLLATGFCLKVMKETINRTPKMPEWGDWGELFVKGLIGAIISFIYLLIPVIVIAAMTGGAVFSMGMRSGMPFPMMISAMVIGGLLAVLFGFFVPMALAMYVSDGSMSDAFRIKEVVSRIKSVLGEYITAYIVIILLSVLLLLISGIPIIGWLIATFGSFYVGVVAAHMFGEVYTSSVA